LGGTPNVSVNWSDGNVESFTTTGIKSHTYSLRGNYRVKISGTLTSFYSNGVSQANANFVGVHNWGNTGLTSLANAFYSVGTITTVPPNFPSTVTNCFNLFFNSNFPDTGNNTATWDVGNVTNMENMFYTTQLNANLANWNVSKVTTMKNMFFNSSNFNQPIGNWNVSNVLDMTSMFDSATAFNQSIGNWNTGNVANMAQMFDSATAFNQSIGNWNVSKVPNRTNMASMFNGASSFNQDLTNWCVANITTAPLGFSSSTAAWVKENRLPLWAYCPQSLTPSTITFIDSATGGNTATLPAQQNGDVIVAFAYRDGSTTPPSIPAGESWANVTGAGTSDSYVLAWNISNGNRTTGTWTNATNVIFSVYRGANTTTPIANIGGLDQGVIDYTGTSTSLLYGNNAYYFDQSWVIAFAGHTQLNSNIANVPGNLVNRAYQANVTSNSVVAAFDSNAIYDKWPNTTVNINGTSGGWITVTTRLIANLS
jgi:surface protein